MIRDLFAVAIGGAVGSALRTLLGTTVARSISATAVNLSLDTLSASALATLMINGLGCFLIGLLTIAGEHLHLVTPTTRPLLFAGFLGGFTTYSTFALDSVLLFRQHGALSATLHIALHLVLGIGGVWCGMNLGARFTGGA